MPTRPCALLVVASLLTGAGLSAEARAEDDKLRTVVVGLQARRNVDEGLALAMSDVVQGEVLREPGRVVFGRTDLQRVLEFETERQALGCTDDTCLAEVASALAADRLVTGSMDKVGSSYFVVITEIDAQEVVPVGRVQRRLPLNEDQLIVGVQELTRELMRMNRPKRSRAEKKQKQRPPPDDLGPVAVRQMGSVSVVSVPAGAEVFLDDKSMGRTPVRLDGVPAGAARIRVRMDEGDPVLLDVPVTAEELTEVEAQIRVPDTVSRAERDRYEEALSSYDTGRYARWGVAGGLCCCASPLALLLPGLLGTALASSAGTGAAGVGWLCGAGCCLLPAAGGIGSGVWALLGDPPQEPQAGDGYVHRIEVRPAGAEPILFEVEAAAPPEDDPEGGSGDDDDRDRREEPEQAPPPAPDVPEPAAGSQTSTPPAPGALEEGGRAHQSPARAEAPARGAARLEGALRY